ncbi:Outer membrane TonB-dependent transporter, utilization system for glycans and polysaccharides (PUL), SusC family, partial [hydrothermal vent metagenome]
MKRNLYLFMLLFFIVGSVFAQTVQVTGTVTNGEGQSLPGVSILIKGTTRGTVSDTQGKYTLEVKKGAVL